jgi:hypothetical protein
MIKQDFILLIFNCEKYRYKALKQKDTWLQQLPPNIIYYHVLGQVQSTNLNQGQSPNLNPNLDQDYIIDEPNKILYVNVADDYNSLPKKVIAAYKAINSIYDFKYIFKTDDDQNVKNTRFFNILMIILKNDANANAIKTHYGGHIVDIKQPEKSTYYRIHPELPKNLILHATRYCSGRFYFLSWEAVQKLIERKNDICNEYFEDYAIGYYLPSNLKNNMLQLDTDKHFNEFLPPLMMTFGHPKVEPNQPFRKVEPNQPFRKVEPNIDQK